MTTYSQIAEPPAIVPPYRAIGGSINGVRWGTILGPFTARPTMRRGRACP